MIPIEHEKGVSINDAHYLINMGVEVKELAQHVKVLPPDLDKIPRRFLPEERVAMVLKKSQPTPEALIDALRERTALAKLGEDTLVSVAERCAKNIMRNIERMTSTVIATKLVNPLENIPAFIVGAGPSLDKNAHLLPECAKHGVIFGLDMSASAITAQGVEPDVMVSLESKGMSKCLTYKQDKPYNILAVDITAAPENWDVDHKRRVCFTNSDPAYSEIITELGGVPLAFGGSVSLTAFALAYYWGCNPIILLGQDLAYTGQRTYATNCIFEEQTIKRTKADDPRKGDMIEFIGCPERGRNKPISVVDAAAWGDPKTTVETSHEMLTYRDWTAETSQKINARVINATEGGLHTKNIIEWPLQKVLNMLSVKKPIPKEYIIADLHDAIDNTGPSTHEEVEEYKLSIRKRLKYVCEVIAENQFNPTPESIYKVRESTFVVPLVEAFMVKWALMRKQATVYDGIEEANKTQREAIMNGVATMLFILEDLDNKKAGE
jgi:hypothetical protein